MKRLILLAVLLTSQPAMAELLEKPKACKPADPEAFVRLDFDGSTLHELVREVGRVLCKRFVLLPHDAKQEIIVVSGAETRVGTLWLSFLHILAANGFTVVDRGDYHAIIHAVDATRENVPTYGPGDPVPPEERMITKIVVVKDRDIKATTNFLNIFKSPKGQIHPEFAAKRLVITDFASSVARLEWILASTPPAPAK